MQIAEGKRDEWKQYVDLNSDHYGSACVQFAERWANAMETEIANGQLLEAIAKRTSLEQANGISGFQYGAAVAMLSRVWIHGEQLRRWHNLDIQLHDEGAQANADGGVLNPAVLHVEVRDG